MPIPDEFRGIIQSLEEGTGTNRVPWTTTGAEGVFVVVYGEYSVSIAQQRVRRPDSPVTQISYRLAALDINGEEIDAFTIGTADHSAYATLRALWNAARRKANNIDEKLAAIAERIRVGNRSGPRPTRPPSPPTPPPPPVPPPRPTPPPPPPTPPPS